MAVEGGIPAGVPPINFQVHEVRCGEAGAPLEFEQMLALLIQTVRGKTYQVRPAQGDWGIDALVGDLNGEAQIWQAKYYLRSFQREKVEESFAAALRNAGKHGYRMTFWALCIPRSLTPPDLQYWLRWTHDQQTTHGSLGIELWDETRLSDLLRRPAAEHIRRTFYDPYRDPAPPPTPHLTISSSGAAQWRGGETFTVGDARYLLHDPIERRHAPDRSWTWQEADAVRRDVPATERVRIRQLVAPPGAVLEQARQGLRTQAEALSAMRGLPRLIGRYERSDTVTLITELPRGAVSWRKVFGRGVDRLAAAGVVTAAASLCSRLAALHERGYAHLALDQDGVLLIDRRRQAVFRDLGMTALPTLLGEGYLPYPAPEQELFSSARPGPPTDVFQLAALVRHTLTGYSPSSGANAPIRATMREFPAALDETLSACLKPDPQARPGISEVRRALIAGRRGLSEPEAR